MTGKTLELQNLDWTYLMDGDPVNGLCTSLGHMAPLSYRGELPSPGVSLNRDRASTVGQIVRTQARLLSCKQCSYRRPCQPSGPSACGHVRGIVFMTKKGSSK